MNSPAGTQSTPYFDALNALLKAQGQGVPHLVIDLEQLDQNILALQDSWPSNTNLRLVVKSLPSIDLLHYLSSSLRCQHFMTFHLPFLLAMVQAFPDSDLLLGKPLPVRAVNQFYQHLESLDSDFDSKQQLSWLIDTPQRLSQYLAVAQKHQQQMGIAIELDIGLHRGGVSSTTELDVLLTQIRNHPKFLRLTGFMGYDAHVGKLPKFIETQQTSYQKSQDKYQAFIDYTRTYFSELTPETLLLNGAGSPTIELHKQASLCNDLSIGSALVKPSHFDLPLLKKYHAASYICSPVLKQWPGMKLPGPEWLSRLIQQFQPGMQQTFFIYGGGWKADLVDDQLKENALYGASANQAIVNGSHSVRLQPDDHIFWRPQESEAVFLQFGRILAIRGDKIEAQWPVLQNH
ncbi:alanine racemase [Litoribrevibacter euphylliae]|uniref:Alanine racemase n=1 Tax=Litoribrevibacter euphylliae TaxID=1834034 RepID=A0ABV7HF75_9GAMM